MCCQRISRRKRSSENSVVSMPAIRTRPANAATLRGSTRSSAFASELLPQPDSPSTTSASLRPTSKLTSSTARTVPLRVR